MAWQLSSAFAEEVPFLREAVAVPLNIAIVDDERELTNLLVMVLNASGRFNVVATAASGVEALIIVEDRNIDAILVDLCLPGLNGIMVLERLRETAPGLPVVIMSGFPIVDVYSRGARGYLEKQGDLEDFPTKLFNLLVPAD